MDWQRMIPGAEDISAADWASAREIRLRAGQPVTLCLRDGKAFGRRPLTAEEVNRAAGALSRHGLAAHRGEMARGFLPLPGGHRLGVCGVMGDGGLKEITSLCLRLCREAPGAGEAVYPAVRGCHTLIAGPPGAGKTTLLRDLIRRYSLDGLPVGVVDERGEIAACRDGAPQLDVGPMTDVVTGLDRVQGFSLLIRAMAPRIVAADEIGGAEDIRAAQDAMRCGAAVLTTVHAKDLSDMAARLGVSPPDWGGFQRAVLLTAPEEKPQVIRLEGREDI